jgi:hypothetical protein
MRRKGSNDAANLFKAIEVAVADPTSANLKDLESLADYIVCRRVGYGALVKFISEERPEEWKRIEEGIESAYNRRIFILKRGELEDYLGIRGRGLDKIIDFTQNPFGRWQADPDTESCRNELMFIYRNIFG